MEKMCGAAERRFGEAGGQSLAITVWAVTKLGYHPGQRWCERRVRDWMQARSCRVDICRHDDSLPLLIMQAGVIFT